MRGAKHDEIVLVVVAAVSAPLQVMKVHEIDVATTRNDATAVIASHDFASNGGRNRLRRTPRTHVGATRRLYAANLLHIALGHLDDLGADFDELTAALLESTAAMLADRHRNLVARASFVPGPAEQVPCHQ